jgi:hypothetical protein
MSPWEGFDIIVELDKDFRHFFPLLPSPIEESVKGLTDFLDEKGRCRDAGGVGTFVSRPRPW